MGALGNKLPSQGSTARSQGPTTLPPAARKRAAIHDSGERQRAKGGPPEAFTRE